MTDEQYRSLCNVYGFAPSRSLRELLDTVVSQARVSERHACADTVERMGIKGFGTLAIAVAIRRGIELERESLK